MNNHTHGPWIVQMHDGYSGDLTIAAVSGHEVANVSGVDAHLPNGSAEDRTTLGVELVANARLISAAPDLLSACTEAAAWIENFSEGPADDARVSVLRAAIAKARGVLR